MTPRPKVDADPVAMATMERIRRDLNQRPPQRGLQWGAVVCALFVGYLGANLASRKSSGDPVAVTSQQGQQQVIARATPTSDDIRRRQSAPGYRPDAAVDDPNAVANNWSQSDRAPRALAVEPDRSAPRPQGDYFNVELPDGRRIHSTVRAAVSHFGALPFTGNRIGDARYVGVDGHWYVWTVPVGGNTASWIDP